jgi:hypothetical protein
MRVSPSSKFSYSCDANAFSCATPSSVMLPDSARAGGTGGEDWLVSGLLGEEVQASAAGYEHVYVPS